MKNTRTVRIAAGTVCLIVVALVMGWFVGRYIPASATGSILKPDTGYLRSSISIRDQR